MYVPIKNLTELGLKYYYALHMLNHDEPELPAENKLQNKWNVKKK